MPQYETTTIWLMLTLADGDILNVRTISASRMTALESMVNNAENDIEETNKWYKLVRYDYFGDAVGPGSTLWVVFDLAAETAVMDDLKLVGIYAREDDIPQSVHDHDDDYWIDDVTLV
jgi:hypothetical protein